MTDLVRIDRNGPIAEVVLNRPEKRNALDLPTFEALLAAGLRLRDDDKIGAVILRGEGGTFCAGLDVSDFPAIRDRFRTEYRKPVDGAANCFQAICTVWRSLSIPVIAVLEGAAVGGGFQLAMGADIRVAHPATKMSIMEIKWGLIPDMGLTSLSRGVIRHDILSELALTGRIFPASEGARLGVVTVVDDSPLEKARYLASEIAGKSPDAVRGIKKLIISMTECTSDEGLQLEARLQEMVMGGKNHREQVAANIERRSPRFTSAVVT